MASAMNVRDELAASNLGENHKGAIGQAIDDKLATLGAQQQQRPSRPRGPSAEERGAQAVPTGSGDDGEWVHGFNARLGRITHPAALTDMQKQIGAAVKSKTITPAKSAELSKAVKDKRRALEDVAA
jgi:hypothetical protein